MAVFDNTALFFATTTAILSQARRAFRLYHIRCTSGSTPDARCRNPQEQLRIAESIDWRSALHRSLATGSDTTPQVAAYRPGAVNQAGHIPNAALKLERSLTNLVCEQPGSGRVRAIPVHPQLNPVGRRTPKCRFPHAMLGGATDRGVDRRVHLSTKEEEE